MRGVFVIKIIYNKDKDLRTIEDALDNSLDNLHFYIPKKLQGSFYCRLVDSNESESILKLSKSDSSDKLYDIYKVSLDNFISCENGNIKLSILQNCWIWSDKCRWLRLNIGNSIRSIEIIEIILNIIKV